MRKLILIALLALSNASFASNDIIKTPVKIGSATFQWLFWDAYDIALFTSDGKFHFEKPFYLELKYKTDISGKDIAEKSIEEMQEIAPIEESKSQKWLKAMENAFPNVKKGTVLTGLNDPEIGVIFYKDGAKIAEIKDKEFAKRFFEIWLSPKTSQPSLRKKLLGEK